MMSVQYTTPMSLSMDALGYSKGCKSHSLLIYTLNCGERGIRTPGTSQFNGFQDRRNRPLCHLSLGQFHSLLGLGGNQRRSLTRAKILYFAEFAIAEFFIYTLLHCTALLFIPWGWKEAWA